MVQICIYISLPNIINARHIQQLKEVLLPPVQKSCGNIQADRHSHLYYFGCRLVSLLKLMYAPLSLYIYIIFYLLFKLIDFLFQTFPLPVPRS